MGRQPLLILLLLLLPTAAFGQADTLCVSEDGLRGLRAEHVELERRVALQDTLIEEQRLQLQLYQKRLKQDSTVIKAKEREISDLNSRNRWLKAGAVLSAIVGFLLG